ncbi:hypothetical protein BU23DRAFT_128019 [Bimuria novae-zelandiae CBS 107.79]|uniref:Uncharacterized protein n=1 Tax=Bimuria novae-zelandiae CBS 107.79 TaxID=1447943 RepID=A0A6A5VF44_9PLEO|nr:hypothetical protein BU23DRAFT_128019 [Bimuria novae-zelandiae CBS 107.79]
MDGATSSLLKMVPQPLNVMRLSSLPTDQRESKVNKAPAPVSWVAPLPPEIKTSRPAKSDEPQPSGRTLDELFRPGIRNKLYEELLNFPDPLKIAICAQDGKSHLYHQVGDGNEKLFRGSLRVTTRQHTQSEFPPPRMHSAVLIRTSVDIAGKLKYHSGDLVRAFIPGLGLLYCCRKIYHEAAGFFFKNNRFNITHVNRAPTNWQFGAYTLSQYWLEYPLEEITCFLAWGNWMKVLGSQLPAINLKKVIIDTGTLFLADYGCDYFWVNALKAASVPFAGDMLDVTPLVFAY